MTEPGEARKWLEGASLKTISGLPGGSEAWWLWLNRETLAHVLVLTSSDDAAQTLFDDFQALERWQDPASPGRAVYFPEDEPDSRIAALSAWMRTDPETRAPFLIASWEMVHAPLPPPEDFQKSHRKLNLGDRRNRDEFLDHLTLLGYSRVDTVEQTGEAAVRGEVVDLWSPGWDYPVRILWPFDQIESLRKIDLTTQRSTDALEVVLVRPLLPKGPADGLRPAGTSLLSYLGEEGVLFTSLLPPEAEASWEGRSIRRVDPESGDVNEPYLSLPPLAEPGDRMAFFVSHVKDWLAQDWRVLIFCHNPGEQERMEEILIERDRALADEIRSRRIDFPIGPLVRGFLDPARKLAILSNGEIFGRYRRRLRLPKFTGGKTLSEVSELSRGDYVVHERFGVGRYSGLEHIHAGGVEADYLRLEYKGGDRVFVPLFEFKQVQKYIGAEGKKPKISSLDTATWERMKQDVQESVAELARELLARAAKRTALPGFSFPPDSHMEKEFAASFLYELTPDQARAIEEAKRDMV
ncbi:MAG: hypothetical protein HY548_01335, partial [Elusimicrobia bacterium]|nr:hypothetical protein [Elusimicrobiota bacterium]